MSDEATSLTVRALICEDEPLAIRALQAYLRGVEWIRLVGEAQTGPEAVRMIQKLEPDLVFLDVRMPGLTGLEVLDAITHSPATVFTTAYDEYAISAFEAGAVDYLVKPFGRERLTATLDRVRVRLLGEGFGPDVQPSALRRSSYAERIYPRHQGRIVPVPVADILRVEAAPGGVSVVTKEGAFSLNMTVGELEKRLSPRDFIRVHRSHIVNLAHVRSMEMYDERRLTLSIADGSNLIASRRGSKRLREVMR